jgi:hypothetical protein
LNEITAIVPCSTSVRQASAFLEHLVALGEAGAIHLVLITPPGAAAPRVPDGFRSVRRIAVERGWGSEHARALAVAEAATDVVAFFEDHVRFDRPWVEHALRRTREDGAAAVGWTVRPGHAHELIRLAGWLVEYSTWGPGRPAGASDHLPGHNCVYRRDALLGVGPDLPWLLRAESVLHWHLARRGGTLLFDRDVTFAHYSFPSVALQVRTDFWYGWSFADVRARDEGWGPGTRLLRATLAPLVPFVRAVRLIRTARGNGTPPGALLRCAPIVALTLSAGSLGEALGTLLGERGAAARLTLLDSSPRRLVEGG